MENIGKKSVVEIIEIKNNYVKKYIGDLHKPTEYNINIKLLNKLIQAKG